MKLEEIGFYTLSDERARNISASSAMQRCEILITDRCNFKCPYCRGIRSDCAGMLNVDKIKEIIDYWAADSLKNIRFSGGEPTTHPGIEEVVRYARSKGVNRVAISTNGSNSLSLYKRLIAEGVNDFSISLDACCAAGFDKMSGVSSQFDKVINNIRELSKVTYVTVGIVITNDNANKACDIIRFVHELGVADIRIISAAQYNKRLEDVFRLPQNILRAHPILKYREKNIRSGRNVRGIRHHNTNRCHLVKDDSAVAGKYHFPCIIYLREGGEPIGMVGPNMRQERIDWFNRTDTHKDPICRTNCLDVCIDFNDRCEEIAL